MRALLLPVAAVFLSACEGGKGTPDPAEASVPAATLFTQLDPASTGIDFVNVLTESDEWNIFTYEYIYNGAGIGAGDLNNDGLCDLYFVSNTGQDKLFLNKGGMRFEDITERAGIAPSGGYRTGVSMADVNGDGWLDIHVCRDADNRPELRRNLLYVNNGDGTFRERAREFGLDDPSYSTQAYFFDMDLDGDLDMYLVNHPGDLRNTNQVKVERDPSGKLVLYQEKQNEHISDRLYRNDGSRFTEISAQARTQNAAYGLSAVVGRITDDIKPDVFAANDYVMHDHLWVNQGGNRFTSEGPDRFPHFTFNSMGSDMADYNNDGAPDIICADMTARDPYRYKTLTMTANHSKHELLLDVDVVPQYSANALYLNNGDGSFSDIAFMAGVAYTDWSWSPLFADLDNDGWKDLLVTNGYVHDVNNLDYLRYTMDSLKKALIADRITLGQYIASMPSVKLRSFLFRNNGDLTFSDRTQEWNAGPPAFSNGAAYADLDNDGDLDLVTNNINEQAFVLRNDADRPAKNRSVRVQLDAGKGRTAIGARVRLTLDDGSRQWLDLQPARGFLSCSEPVLHFGIPEGRTPKALEITWPDGAVQEAVPSVGSLIKITRAAPATTIPRPATAALIVDRSSALPKDLGHRQNRYIDFKREPLLHQKLSEEGPAAAVGDVNGDGLDDLFIGGGMGSTARLALQRADGGFSEVKVPAFISDSTHEDVAALFFDADGDDDLDLYVGSGGNERPAGDEAYRDRLYLNDGKGGFARMPDALPDARESTGCVAAHDIDGDGDLDLFVGARVVPGRYPEPPRSAFLRNERGRFIDATGEWAAGLDRLGMISAARFADLNGDSAAELVLAGEWMPITVLQWDGRTYRNATADRGLNGTEGWWCGLDIADADGDGKPEILAINAGLNSHWSAAPDAPMQLCYKDFDGNGSLDAVLCQTVNGVAYPAHNRDRMLDQMVFLKKRFLRYEAYARASFDDVFTENERQGVRTLKAVTLAHTVFWNDGERFRAEQLPLIAQRSMARASRFVALDDSGRPGLLIAGNFFGTDAQFGRYDAEAGLLLRRDGGVWNADKGHMDRLLRDDVRHAIPVMVHDRKNWLVVRNNGVAGLVEFHHPSP